MICDVDLLCRAQEGASFIGITGTNGKSTTTALTAHVFRRANRATEVGGNLGTPALELSALGALGTYVLELSSYQLELVPSLALETAIFLNITPDHIDRHGTLEGYIAAKKRISQISVIRARRLSALMTHTVQHCAGSSRAKVCTK